MNKTKDERLTVRLKPGEMRSLRELAAKLKVSNSLLVRTIILDFLVKNEDVLERIITKEEENGKDQSTSKEA